VTPVKIAGFEFQPRRCPPSIRVKTTSDSARGVIPVSRCGAAAVPPPHFMHAPLCLGLLDPVFSRGQLRTISSSRSPPLLAPISRAGTLSFQFLRLVPPKPLGCLRCGAGWGGLGGRGCFWGFWVAQRWFRPSSASPFRNPTTLDEKSPLRQTPPPPDPQRPSAPPFENSIPPAPLFSQYPGTSLQTCVPNPHLVRNHQLAAAHSHHLRNVSFSTPPPPPPPPSPPCPPPLRSCKSRVINSGSPRSSPVEQVSG